MGIRKPPADSIAAVDPAAVDTLKPLDRQLVRGELAFPSFLILKERKSNSKIKLKLNNLQFSYNSEPKRLQVNFSMGETRLVYLCRTETLMSQLQIHYAK